MLTCMQKVNFVINFSLKMYQRNSKLFVLDNLGMSSRTHQKWQYHFEKMFDNYQQGKINSILYVFREILQRYYKVFLGSWPCTPKWYHQYVEKICVYIQVKNQFHSPCFSGDTARYSNLFWVLWACLVIHNQNDSINF